VRPPGGERFLVLPFHDGEAFTVLGRVVLVLDEARHRGRRRQHFRGHGLVVLTRIGAKTGAEDDQQHPAIIDQRTVEHQ
jgi:hypothetical protein